MKLVKFKDSRYGIRKLTLLGYRYLSLNTKEFWWGIGDNHFEACKGDYEKALKAFNDMTDTGTPVKPIDSPGGIG